MTNPTTPTEQDEELREAIYGLAFAVETHPDDFVLRINEKGVNELLALIQQKQLEVLSDCRSHGERGGHDVYTQTIGEQVLRKIDELSTPPKKEETDK